MDEGPKEREPTPFDTAFKMAAEREPEALLRLVGEAGEVIRAVPGEVQLVRRADYVARVEREGRARIVHIEFERNPGPDLARRVLVYNAALLARERLSVTSIVLLASEGRRAAVQSSAVFGSVAVTFRLVRLRDHPELVFDPALAEFGPLTVEPRKRAIALENARENLLGERRADQLGQLAQIGLALGLDPDRMTLLEAEMFATMKQVRQEAIEQGIEQGILRGVALDRVTLLRSLGVSVPDALLPAVVALAPERFVELLGVVQRGPGEDLYGVLLRLAGGALGS